MTEDVVAMLGRRDWGDRQLSAMLTSREIQFAAETAASLFPFIFLFGKALFSVVSGLSIFVLYSPLMRWSPEISNMFRTKPDTLPKYSGQFQRVSDIIGHFALEAIIIIKHQHEILWNSAETGSRG